MDLHATKIISTSSPASASSPDNKPAAHSLCRRGVRSIVLDPVALVRLAAGFYAGRKRRQERKRRWHKCCLAGQAACLSDYGVAPLGGVSGAKPLMRLVHPIALPAPRHGRHRTAIRASAPVCRQHSLHDQLPSLLPGPDPLYLGPCREVRWRPNPVVGRPAEPSWNGTFRSGQADGCAPCYCEVGK